MSNRIRMTGAVLGAALVLALGAEALAQQQQMRPIHVRAQIEAVEGSTLHLKDRAGKMVMVALPEKVRVSSLAKASIDAIKKGNYVGTAAVPAPDGTLIAQEVLIFPETQRGTGEGHRKWDLTPDSTMTNATVDTVVSDVKGRVLTLKYKGGEKKLTIPADAPIVTTGPGDPSLLKPGSHVFVVATQGADGKLTAQRVAVGKDGLVPPM